MRMGLMLTKKGNNFHKNQPMKIETNIVKSRPTIPQLGGMKNMVKTFISRGVSCG